MITFAYRKQIDINQLMKRIVIILCLLIAAFDVFGQKLTVEKMEVAPMDLSASTQPRNDRNGNPCALVKVLMVDGLDRVEGNVIGDVEDRGTEKWVYLSAGTKMMKIVPKNHLPLMITFADYGIKKAESKVTYTLALVEPALKGQEAEYNYGKGKEQNYQKAFRLFKESAEENHSDLAQYYLGECYANGHGTFPNASLAVEWYEKSAEAHYLPALMRLGEYYENGTGVQKDMNQSRQWYRQAAEMGNQDAKKKLK